MVNLDYLFRSSYILSKHFKFSLSMVVRVRNKKIIKDIAVKTYKVNLKRNLFIVFSIVITTFMITAILALVMSYRRNRHTMNFEVIPETDIAPEVGSRGITTLFILQNIATGDAIGFLTWNEVQENIYRYQVSHNEDGDIIVKIVIFEFLYCVVEFGT